MNYWKPSTNGQTSHVVDILTFEFVWRFVGWERGFALKYCAKIQNSIIAIGVAFLERLNRRCWDRLLACVDIRLMKADIGYTELEMVGINKYRGFVSDGITRRNISRCRYWHTTVTNGHAVTDAYIWQPGWITYTLTDLSSQNITQALLLHHPRNLWLFFLWLFNAHRFSLSVYSMRMTAIGRNRH